jgi:hypothetical protein
LALILFLLGATFSSFTSSLLLFTQALFFL